MSFSYLFVWVIKILRKYQLFLYGLLIIMLFYFWFCMTQLCLKVA